MSLDHLFEQIHAINHMVGNTKDASWSKLKRQATLLLHEVEELVTAIEEQDFKETRDGAADVAFVLAGFEHMFVPLAPDLDAVVRSNLSKFDVSEDDALLTKTKYDTQGINTRYEYRYIPITARLGTFEHDGYYVTYVDGEQDMNGQRVPDGKWLKSHRFVEPQFPLILQDQLTT